MYSKWEAPEGGVEGIVLPEDNSTDIFTFSESGKSYNIVGTFGVSAPNGRSYKPDIRVKNIYRVNEGDTTKELGGKGFTLGADGANGLCQALLAMHVSSPEEICNCLRNDYVEAFEYIKDFEEGDEEYDIGLGADDCI